MVSEEIIKIASRYLRRDEEEIEEVFESIGIKTVEDLANADPTKVAEAFNIKESTARKMTNNAKFLSSGESSGKSKSASREDIVVPPYVAAISILWSARGTIMTVLCGESFTGKTSLATFVADRVIAVPERRNSGITVAALRESVRKAKFGIVIDDLQWLQRTDEIRRLCRAVTNYKALDGVNRTNEVDIEKVVRSIINHSKVLTSTLDLSSGNYPLEPSDGKRTMIVPAPKATVSLPFRVEVWLTGVRTMKYTSARGRDANDIFDFSDIYTDYHETVTGTREYVNQVNSVLSCSKPTVRIRELRELSKEDIEEWVIPVYTEYTDIIEVYDDELVDWWKEVSELYLLRGTWKEDAKGRDRKKMVTRWLITAGLSSIIGARYEWEFSSRKELQECIELTKESVTALTGESCRSLAREMKEICEKNKPPI